MTDDLLEIELFLDDPSCAFAGQIMLNLRQAVRDVAGGREVRMTIVYDEAWNSDRISAAGQRKLLAARTALQQSVARQKTR